MILLNDFLTIFSLLTLTVVPYSCVYWLYKNKDKIGVVNEKWEPVISFLKEDDEESLKKQSRSPFAVW